MKRLCTLVFVAVSMTTSLCANAAPWPEKAYTAVYENSGPYGTAMRKVIWDGRGHGRTEMTSNGKVRIGIVDATNHTMTMVIDGKTMTMPMRDEDMAQLGIEAQKQISDRVPLGTKMIDGHECTGERYSLSGFKTEAWTDKALGLHRLTKTTNPAMPGTSVTKLVSYTAGQPDPALFKLPAK